MRRITLASNGGQLSTFEDGNFYWVRVTSFTGSYLLTLDDQKSILIDSLLHYVSKGNSGGATYKRVTLSTNGATNAGFNAIVEVGEFPDEPDPGPVNAPASPSAVALATQTANNSVASFSNAVLIQGQDVGQGVLNAYSAPLANETVVPGTDAGFPMMAANDGGTVLWNFVKSDATGRLKIAPRGGDWQLANTTVAAGTATATQAAAVGKRHITLGGTASIAGMVAAGTVTVQVLDGATVIWAAVLGGVAVSASSVNIPAGLFGSVNTAMTVAFTGGLAGALESVSLNGYDSNNV